MFKQNEDTLNTQSTIGLIFLMVLFLTFFVLKLTGTIDWSWWWVFAPMWIPWGIGLIGMILGIKPPQF